MALHQKFTGCTSVVTVADVDAEKRVDDSWVQIWKPKFGHKI